MIPKDRCERFRIWKITTVSACAFVIVLESVKCCLMVAV